jgi:polysaccharide biosynthesis protein PslH
MRILILTPQLPYPPRQGTALRNWGILSNLARHHEVWLLSFDEQASDAQSVNIAPQLLGACHQVSAFPVPRRTTADRLRTLVTSPLPDMAWRLWSPQFAERLGEWVTQNTFDIIQVEGIELARYILQTRIDNRRTRVVFDDHNCEYLLQRRAFETDLRQPLRWHAAAYSLVQWRRLRDFERRAAKYAHATLCVSPQDAALLSALDPSIHAHVIFNGIDVQSYQHIAATPSKTPTLVFTGKMDFRPNVDAMLWFCANVFPRIRQIVPDVQMLIVGQRPSPRLDVLREDSSITLTGEVDDVRPYIAGAQVYVAPLWVGGGTRFKLLESMAMRKAIVSTTLGCEGFEVTSGKELIIADSHVDFAEATVRLLKDETERLKLGRQAHAFVNSRYDWSAIVPRLERVYNNILNS